MLYNIPARVRVSTTLRHKLEITHHEKVPIMRVCSIGHFATFGLCAWPSCKKNFFVNIKSRLIICKGTTWFCIL